MNLRQLQQLLVTARAHWFAVALCTLLGALAGAWVSMVVPVSYQASARLFVASPNWNDSTASAQPDLRGRVPVYSFGDEFTQRRVLTYQQLADTQRVASAVIQRLNLQTSSAELAGRLSARAIPDTVILEVHARDGSPEGAAAIADAAADEVANEIKALEKPFARVESPVQPVLIEPASAPPGPASPRILLNVLAGAILGLLVGLTYGAVRARRRAADFPADLAVSDTTLSVLHGAEDVGAFVHLDDLGHELAEDTRFLCLRLTAELKDAETQTLLFASPRATDAVGPTAVLVAAGFAELGHRVAVVLTNFAATGTSAPEPGLGDVLDGRQRLDAVLKFDDTGRVGVVMPGSTESSSIAALASDRMESVVQRLESGFDYVIIIGCPVLESADSLELASKLAAAILICPVPPTTDGEIEEAERLLGRLSESLLGRVVVVDWSPEAKARRKSSAERRDYDVVRKA